MQFKHATWIIYPSTDKLVIVSKEKNKCCTEKNMNEYFKIQNNHEIIN